MNLNFFLCLPFFFPPPPLSHSFPPFFVVFKFYVTSFCPYPVVLLTSLSAFTISLGLERGIVLSCREFRRPLGGDQTYAPVGVPYPNDRLALPRLGTLGVVVSGERRRPSTLLKKRYYKQKMSTHSFQNTSDNKKSSKHSRLYCLFVALGCLCCCLCLSVCLCACVSLCLRNYTVFCLCHRLSLPLFVSLTLWRPPFSSSYPASVW